MILRSQFLLFLCCVFFARVSFSEEKVVHVYCWAETIDAQVIKDFEKETGIKVKLDYYDAEEVLETKLLTNSRLYDVVMPSAMPYYGRQVQLKLYRPLNKSLLSHWKNLDPRILKILETIDPGNQYGIPYSWGTTGFVYNPDKIRKYLPLDMALNTYQLILDEPTIKKLSPCGVGLLDQPQDLFEAFFAYLKIKPNYKDLGQLDFMKKVLEKVRPYIKFFTSNPEKMIGSLLNGEACLVQMWSGEALRAQLIAAEKNKKLVFSVPKEHAGVWCDLMAIPKNAPHPENAHLFINFMLRPEVAAKNMETTLMTIPNLGAREKLPQHLRNNETLFPSQMVLNTLKMSDVLPLDYERKTTRTWAHIKAKS